MKKILWIIGLLSAAAIGSIGFLTVNTRQKAVSEFPTSGYILDTDETSGTAEMQQYYFNAGENYSTNSALDTVSFKTVEGNKVSVRKASYIHYNDSSMEAMTKTVIFDTDESDAAALSYYAIPGTTKLVRGGDCYTVSTDGYEKDFRNFVWKISDTDYMVVSDEVKLVVSEEEEVSFPDYVQVKYKDSGVVYLTTQQGVYSTVSSDAYLELANGIRIYLGSKNVSTDEGIVMNLGQMTVNSEDQVEVAPDQEYKNENTTQPQLIVDASDGEDGEDGKDGENGDAGEPGKNGSKGDAGEDGEDGEEGEEGDAGEAGKAGASGGSGTNGTNGKVGATGAGGAAGEEGDYGQDGSDASTANLNYSEDKMPTFWATIKTSTTINASTQQEEASTCDNVLVFVKYDDTDKTWSVDPDSVNLSILEADSGALVSTIVPKNQGISVTQSGFNVPFTGLDPATNYLLVINAKYTDSNSNSTTKDVLSKNFVTESMGVSLSKRYVTDTSVDFYLTRTSDDPITDVNIQLYDAKKNALDDSAEVKFLIPKNGISSDSQIVTDQKIYFNSTNGVFSISTIPNVGNKLEVVAGTYHEDAQQLIPSIKLEGLETDTVYYAQIKAYERDAGDSVTALSSYSFPMVQFKTLKQAPELDAPKVTTSGYENAFIVSAQDVTDKDNGILSYRYEIYKKGTDGQIGTEPVYTVSSSTPTSVKVPIEGAISVGVTYVARIVAVFDNNEEELEYPSAMSAEFSMTQTWPVVTVEELKKTASTVEGKLKVSDVNKLITRGGSYQIQAVLKPQKALTTGAGTSYDEEVIIATADTKEGLDVYEMNFKAQGLEYATDYNIIVYATEVTVQEGGENVKKGNYPLSTVTLTTDTYTPLALSAVEGSANGSAFVEYILLSTGENTTAGKALYEAEQGKKGTSSSITGVGNLGHFSSKAMENVTLELYYGKDSGNNPKKVGELKVYNKEYCDQHTGDPTYYRFASPSNAVRTKYVSNGQGGYEAQEVQLGSVLNTFYTDKSPEDVAGLKEADCWDSATETSKLGLRVKVDDFEKIDDQGNHTGQPLTYDDLQNQGDQVTVKAIVYDYTYFTGGTSSTWKKTKSDGSTEYCNPIAVSNEVTFSLNKIKPDFDSICKSSYQLAKIYTKNEITDALLQSFKNDSDNKVSNYKKYTAGDLKTDKWGDEMLGTTEVGLEIIGPASGLKSYASDVKYTVYTDEACTEQNKVAESSWIPVDQTATVTTLPNWFFLIDAVDDTKLKRGQVFYVKTEAKLNNYYTQTDYSLTGMIYPTAFTTEGWASAELNPNNQGKTNPFTDVAGHNPQIIFKAFTLDKQVPSISLVQWKGSAVSASTKVTYLLKINDLDEALDVPNGETYTDYKTDYNKIRLYYGSGSNLTEWNNKIVANSDTDSSTGAAAVFPYMIKDADITTREALTVRYWLKNAERGDTTKMGTIALDQYSAKIIEGTEVAFVTSTTGLTDSDTGTMYGKKVSELTDFLPCDFNDEEFSTYFWYTDSASSTDGRSLRKVVLQMTAYQTDPEEATATTMQFDYTYAGTPTFKTGTSYQKQGIAASTTYYKGEIKLNVTTGMTGTELKKLAEYPHMRVSIIGYYDDGSYGLIYADGSDVSSVDYVTQKQDKSSYVDTTNTERNMEDAIYRTGKTISYKTTLDKLSIYYLHSTAASSSQTETENELVYSASGLSKVPRKAAKKDMTSAQTTNLLMKVLPPYTPITANVGYSQADVTLDFKSQGTLVTETGTGNMVKVFYSTNSTFVNGETMTYDEASVFPGVKSYSLTDQNYEAVQTITGLTGNTAYYFRVYGYAGTGTGGGWQLLKSTIPATTSWNHTTSFTFTTAQNIQFASPVGTKYISLPGAADSKTVQVEIPVNDALEADIVNSIETVTLNIYQGSDTSGKLVRTSTNLKDVIVAACQKKKQETGATGKVSFNFVAELDWKSSGDTVMDKIGQASGTEYTFELKVKYKNVTQEVVIFNNYSSTPYVWTTDDGSGKGHVSENEGRNTFLGVVPVVAYNTAQTISYNNRGEFGVAISGYDRLRLLRTVNTSDGTITATDKTKYYVQLYYKVASYRTGCIYYKGEIVKDSNLYYKCKVTKSNDYWVSTDWEELSGFTPDTDTGYPALDENGNAITMELERSIGTNGTVSYVSSANATDGCRFYDLKPGTEYAVHVYAFWDNDNNGTVTLDKSGGSIDYDKSECYSYKTNWKQIPAEKVIFSGLLLKPGANTHYAEITGENLGEVDKIYYQLKVNGVLQSQWSLDKNNPQASGNRRAWAEWSKSSMQTDLYTLDVYGMSDETATYELYVKICSGSEEHSKLAIYGKND